MRVLVTGAQGCIGSWVVKGLLDRGIDVLAYDLDPSQARLSLIASREQVDKVAIQTGRIEDTQRIKDIVKHEEISHIVHLAAVLMPFCQVHPVEGAMVNVIGTLNMFEAARDSGRPVRIAYASSSAVWGPGEAYGDRTVAEEDPTLPATHYGVFKQANENSARVFHATNAISSVGLRPWAVYGVGRDSGLTADPTKAIKAAVLGQPFRIRLSGFMDFQYVEDVAETFIRCLLAPLEGAYVFNMAGDIATMDQFIELLAEVEGRVKELICAEGPQVPVNYRMDDTQLRTHVPGIPKTPLRQGIEKTYRLYKRLLAEDRLSPELG
ncbi:MAG: NAD-dependent epimerase/dehydratase family protein [Acidobacteria bacterium]|nr:NAD-dependent epimerase/dehydratase family protein [Acidobacteriota bacterium]